jgi:nucleotidyltransferase/DNA polymerase involved in DNA repair
MFPQRGLRWLRSKVSIFGNEGHRSVKPLPLEMIEGMTSYDVFRLEELGIDTCYDLASADFIPLLLKTSYGARELIDWILQAKLCVRFGDAVEELRSLGIRTITDLDGLDDAQLDELSKQTPLTLNSLYKATGGSVSDQNIDRLKRAADLLSYYWEGDDPTEPPQP